MEQPSPVAERLIAHVLSDMIDEDGHLKMRLSECCCIPDCDPPPLPICIFFCEDIIF